MIKALEENGNMLIRVIYITFISHIYIHTHIYSHIYITFIRSNFVMDPHFVSPYVSLLGKGLREKNTSLIICVQISMQAVIYLGTSIATVWFPHGVDFSMS